MDELKFSDFEKQTVEIKLTEEEHQMARIVIGLVKQLMIASVSGGEIVCGDSEGNEFSFEKPIHPKQITKMFGFLHQRCLRADSLMDTKGKE